MSNRKTMALRREICNFVMIKVLELAFIVLLSLNSKVAEATGSLETEEIMEAKPVFQEEDGFTIRIESEQEDIGIDLAGTIEASQEQQPETSNRLEDEQPDSSLFENRTEMTGLVLETAAAALVDTRPLAEREAAVAEDIEVEVSQTGERYLVGDGDEDTLVGHDDSSYDSAEFGVNDIMDKATVATNDFSDGGQGESQHKQSEDGIPEDEEAPLVENAEEPSFNKSQIVDDSSEWKGDGIVSNDTASYEKENRAEPKRLSNENFQETLVEDGDIIDFDVLDAVKNESDPTRDGAIQAEQIRSLETPLDDSLSADSVLSSDRPPIAQSHTHTTPAGNTPKEGSLASFFQKVAKGKTKVETEKGSRKHSDEEEPYELAAEPAREVTNEETLMAEDSREGLPKNVGTDTESSKLEMDASEEKGEVEPDKLSSEQTETVPSEEDSAEDSRKEEPKNIEIDAESVPSKKKPKEGSLASFFQKVSGQGGAKAEAHNGAFKPTDGEQPDERVSDTMEGSRKEMTAEDAASEQETVQNTTADSVPLYIGIWGFKAHTEAQPGSSLPPNLLEEFKVTQMGDSGLSSSAEGYKTYPSVDEAEQFDRDHRNSISTHPSSSRSVNADFVEGLDDINKFLEAVDPPDELDVGAAGSSIQEVLMGQGTQIILKRVSLIVRHIRKQIAVRINEFVVRHRNEDGRFVIIAGTQVEELRQKVKTFLESVVLRSKVFAEGLIGSGDDVDDDKFDFGIEKEQLAILQQRLMNQSSDTDDTVSGADAEAFIRTRLAESL